MALRGPGGFGRSRSPERRPTPQRAVGAHHLHAADNVSGVAGGATNPAATSRRWSPPRSNTTNGNLSFADGGSPSAAAAGDLSMASVASSVQGRRAMRLGDPVGDTSAVAGGSFYRNPYPANTNNNTSVRAGNVTNASNVDLSVAGDSSVVGARTPLRWRSRGESALMEVSHTGTTPATTPAEPARAATPRSMPPASPVLPVGSTSADRSTVSAPAMSPTPMAAGGGAGRQQHQQQLSATLDFGSPTSPVAQPAHVGTTAGCGCSCESLVRALAARVLALERSAEVQAAAVDTYSDRTGAALEALHGELLHVRGMLHDKDSSPPVATRRDAPAEQQQRQQQQQHSLPAQHTLELSPTRSSPSPQRYHHRNHNHQNQHADDSGAPADLSRDDAAASMLEILKQERDAARREVAMLREQQQQQQQYRQPRHEQQQLRDPAASATSAYAQQSAVSTTGYENNDTASADVAAALAERARRFHVSHRDLVGNASSPNVATTDNSNSGGGGGGTTAGRRGLASPLRRR